EWILVCPQTQRLSDAWQRDGVVYKVLLSHNTSFHIRIITPRKSFTNPRPDKSQMSHSYKCQLIRNVVILPFKLGRLKLFNNSAIPFTATYSRIYLNAFAECLLAQIDTEEGPEN
ncbi:hypothetical protein L9F63_019706, partial [Diploptera punctata]